MVFDTDVLIWVLRGNPRAIKVLNAEKDRRISAITYMELIKGCRDKSEFQQLRSFVSELGLQVIPVSENISHRASVYMENLALSDCLDLADVFIGATVTELNLVLCTANDKHYKNIPGISLKVFRP